MNFFKFVYIVKGKIKRMVLREIMFKIVRVDFEYFFFWGVMVIK